MKKILLSIAITLITIAGYSQSKGKDYVTMKPDGKVYWIRGGKTIQVMIDIPFKNGNVVNYKGNVTSKQGESTQLKPGDKITMEGTVITLKK